MSSEFNKRLIISSNTSWSIYNFRRGLIHALQEAGYDIVTLAPADDFSRKLERDLGCRHVDIPINRKGKRPHEEVRLFHRYLRFLRKELPLAYLGYTIKPNIYGSLAAHLLRIPVINNIAGLGYVFTRKGLLPRAVKVLYRLALRHSFRVFFQNRDDRALFLKSGIVRADQAILLPGSGVDLDTFRFTELPAENGDGPAFLLIARMLRDKGVEQFVEAARIVRERHPQARFQLLGPIDQGNPAAIAPETLQGWVREGAVEYLGSVDDVRPYIAAATCIVLPSFYREGTPRSLLEAAAMGRPIITTDMPGCRDVVENGINGYLCPPRNSQSLASAILHFLSLPVELRQAMGRASRTKAEHEFDERIVIERYLDALRQCAPLPRRPADMRFGHR